MAFLPPLLPETCNVIDNSTFTPVVRLTDEPCAVYGFQRGHDVLGLGLGPYGEMIYFLFGARVDVRDETDNSVLAQGDTIDCPPGSGSHYYVYRVIDHCRGFPNEYRVAVCSHVGSGANGPRP